MRRMRRTRTTPTTSPCAGTDLVMLAARTDDDVSHLEVYVYEEPVLNGTDEGNLYCHHDLLLPAFPLCIWWMDCPTDGTWRARQPRRPSARCTPASRSGTRRDRRGRAGRDVGRVRGRRHPWGRRKRGRGRRGCASKRWEKDVEEGWEKKTASRERKKKPALKTDGHSDAVLGLSWNAQYRNVLASASADHTVRVWDISTQKTQHVLRHHDGKVQAQEEPGGAHHFALRTLS